MEVFLRYFKLLTEDDEDNLCKDRKLTQIVFNTIYPLRIFCMKYFYEIEFEPITIFYGGNGSGKTTLLNIIADKLKADRRNIECRNKLFKLYVQRCKMRKNNVDDCKITKLIQTSPCKCLKLADFETSHTNQLNCLIYKEKRTISRPF